MAISSSNFIFGILLNYGVGNYAPTLAMLSLMGMDPRLCFPIMAGGAAVVVAGAGARHIRIGEITVQRIFGVTPVAYGQPGSAWAPQAYPALRDMGIGMYLDEADHVGIDDQPFYYGGMLNVFKMRSNLARMELRGGASLAEGKARFTKSYEALRAKGGGTISIYYHPNEWVHTEFWDGVNFSKGANPPRDEWKVPGTRPAAETEQAFQDFDQIRAVHESIARCQVRHCHRADDDLRGPGAARSFHRDDILALARSVQKEITFQRFDGYTLSAADVFSVLTTAMAGLSAVNESPGNLKVARLDGPARTYTASSGGAPTSKFPRSGFERAVLDAVDFSRTRSRIPDEVWIGAESLSPADYLATLGKRSKIASRPERHRPRSFAGPAISLPTATLPTIHPLCGAG